MMAFAFMANATNPDNGRGVGTHWTFNPYTQYNLTLTGVMYLDGESMQNNPRSEYLEIGAFCGDECRGSFTPNPLSLPFFQGYAYQMQIYSNVQSGEEIIFRVWDHEAGVELDVTCTSNITFVADEGFGNLMTPYELTFTSNSSPTPPEPPTTTHWTYNPYTQYNMTLTGIMILDGESMRNNQRSVYLEMGAFCGDECRGSFLATLNPAPFAQGYFYQMQIYSEVQTGETITFKVWDHEVGEEMDVTCTSPIIFEADGGYGNLMTPYELTFVTNTGSSVTISASADPTEGGVVTGAGTYELDSICTLTATANEGYTFVNWTKNDEEVSTETTYSFTVTESAAYVAHFSLNSYEITATVNPEEGGTVAGAGTYNYGQNCILTATANEGYTFINWTKGGEIVSTEATYTFVVTEDAAYVANFQLNSYEITATVNPEETGTVTGAGTYNHFETCTLAATPVEGYHFVNWTKDNEVVSTEATYSFNVTEAAAFVANFEINSYEITVTVNLEEGGTATGAGTYTHGQTCTLTATVNEGYHFVNWTKDGEVVSTETDYSFVVTEAAAFVANFEINSYEITATTNPENAGIITGADMYDHGTTCTLSVVANPGYSFLNWTKDGVEVSTETSFSFVVTEAASYVANFEVVGYEITVTSNPTEGGTATGGGVFVYGATATLTATANEGYHFVNWTKDGEVVSTDDTYSFVVTESAAFVANFQLNSYEIMATANPTAGGTVAGAGTYNHFETCTLTATVNTGYTFINWTKDGVEVSTDLSFSFVVTEAAAYVANFQINSYTISATANPTVGGTITGAGVYNYGTVITLVATANEGYTFINWTKNGVVVSNSMNYSLTVTEDAAYVANFQLNSYQITVAANPVTGGTVTGAGTYNHFETCTLTATPGENYIFVNWTKNGVVVSTDAIYSFTVVDAGDYVATFAPNEFQINATAYPTSGGTVTGEGVYGYGITATLTATANTGFTFLNWTKNGVVVSTNSVYSFTVTEAGNYVANFSRNNYEITAIAIPANGGTIAGAGTYAYGTYCTLTATPVPGYTFVKWTKNGQFVTNSPTYQFRVLENATYEAHFMQDHYYVTVTANPNVGGYVTGEGAYVYGENCTLTAFAYDGYQFVKWTKNGVQVSTEISYTFTVTENVDFVGHFALNQYQITAIADPTEGGSVSGSGSFIHGETVTLTATANNGYHFVNWTKNGNQVSTNATYSFTATESATYVAHFEQTIVTHEVTTEADPVAGGTTTGDGTYNHGAYCTVKANANEGYMFVNWTKNGTVVSTNAEYRFVVNNDTHLVAHFQPNSYQITVSVDPQEGGTATGAGTYAYGATATLTVVPNDEYEFVNWTEDGTVVSTDPTFTVTVTGNHNYVAHLQHVDGISEYNGISVSVFPNPASDKLTIEASESIRMIEIYNINGALVYKQKDCSEKMEVYVTEYAPGTYTIRMITESAVETRRFVKE